MPNGLECARTFHDKLNNNDSNLRGYQTNATLTRMMAYNRLMTTMTTSINKNNEPIFRTSVIDRITKWKSHTKRERKMLVISNYNISSELHFVNTDDGANNATNCFRHTKKTTYFRLQCKHWTDAHTAETKLAELNGKWRKQNWIFVYEFCRR